MLAQALQHCVERLEMPSGVLCNAAPDFQRSIAPLMWLDGDEMLGSSLFGPADDRPGIPPMLEDEAVLLGDKPELQEALKVTTFPHECPETLKHKEPAKQSDTPSPPAPSAMASNSYSDWS